MGKYILVLEDNFDRRDVMSRWLSERLGMYELRLTDDPAEFIGHVVEFRDDILAVSLDHDLHERPDLSTTVTGMDVVDFLVGHEPTFPILLHTSNTQDGRQMRSRLTEGGWSVDWVTPFDDTNWIGADWYPALKRAIRRFAKRERVPDRDEAD